jgi:hypothetical protein
MPKWEFKALAVSTALLVLSPAVARACTPPPTLPVSAPPIPNESADVVRARSEAQALDRQLAETRDRSFHAGWEAALWELSDRIVLAEVVEIGFLRAGPDNLRGTPEVTLRVIQVQRGTAQPRPFMMTYTGMTNCGPTGAVNVVQGNPGQRFVIFARSGRLGPATTIGSYALGDAQDGRTISLLEGRMPPHR